MLRAIVDQARALRPWNRFWAAATAKGEKGEEPDAPGPSSACSLMMSMMSRILPLLE